MRDRAEEAPSAMSPRSTSSDAHAVQRKLAETAAPLMPAPMTRTSGAGSCRNRPITAARETSRIDAPSAASLASRPRGRNRLARTGLRAQAARNGGTP